MVRNIVLALAASIFVSSAVAPAEESFTRGVGVYPGDPAEDFSPSLVAAPVGRRNLALYRAATQSSAWDYNLTAQLVTDGIVETQVPRWFEITTSADWPAPKHEQAFVVDDNIFSGIAVSEPGWIGFELGGGGQPFEVDRVEIALRQVGWQSWVFPAAFGLPDVPPGRCRAGLVPPPAVAPADGAAENQTDGDLEWSLAASADGRDWQPVGRASTPLPALTPPPAIEDGPAAFYDWNRDGNTTAWTAVTFEEPLRYRRFRIKLEDLDCKHWQVSEVRFYSGDERLRVGGPHHFGSAWKSAGLGEEWLAVDLGAEATLDHVVLHWLKPAAEGVVQVSDDGDDWRPVAELTGPEGGGAGVEEIALEPAVAARHLRVLMTRPSSGEGYVLSELKVFGEGGLVAEPQPQPAPEDHGLHLAGGGWRLQRDSRAEGGGEEISQPGYPDDAWIPATVPGTVLTSYVNVGALPDPNFGDHELAISDAFFHADFWYRNEIEGPDLAVGERAFLELDGVNWKAEVYFNGNRLGRVEGAFMRGRFDVTEHLRSGETNALAIRIEKPASPGAAKQHTLAHAGWNGGALGADNPSFHASIGWDWLPTIRGRNIGLWNDVRLEVRGPVTIDDPFLRYELPLPTMSHSPPSGGTSSADAYLDVTLTNHGPEPVAATLRGTLGDVAFEQPVELPGGARHTVALDPSTHPQLRLKEPKLWWPNGHGEPHLYDVELELVTTDGVSDAESFKSGVRQITFNEDAVVEDPDAPLWGPKGALRIFVNGRRVVPRGGNWGFSEANLRYRGREYDIAMRYHREMNFTMVRNWVGQTGDDEFYEAADRHGLLVWQDFWLANPWDGPDPEDEALFLANVSDTIRRIRNHPSIALYCGRNEGDPPPAIDAGIAAAIAELHPGLAYVPNSMFGSVSGGGPYGVRSREYYFTQRATPKPHSELGMTSVVTQDSLELMMPEAARWPMSLEWGLHDFNLLSNQRARDFVATIDHGYGGAEDPSDWLATAQLVNYDGYRAMFEAQSRHRMGLQLWMSHPAWPSLTWQTYDYYFNPHASFFGSRKGSEPLHVQWHPLTDEVEVVNYGVEGGEGLTASAQVLNLDGSVAWEQTAAVDSAYDSTVSPFALDFASLDPLRGNPEGLTPVHFIRLELSRGDELISENFYWRGTEPGNYRALRTLPEVAVQATTRTERQGDRYLLTTELENPSASPALAVRVVAVRAESGDRVLPVHYSDNFVPLMPGEKRVIRTEVLAADARGEEPRIRVEGYNVAVDAAGR